MQRLSRRLQAGLRLLRAPLPASHRLTLRAAFRPSVREKRRERTGLPRSALTTGSDRFCLDAGGTTFAAEEDVASAPGHVPFGDSETAACAVSGLTARVWQFSFLNHTIRSWLLTGVRLPVASVPRGRLTSSLN